MTLVYPAPGEESYGCLECGWDVPLVDGLIPTVCGDCGDPASEVNAAGPAEAGPTRELGAADGSSDQQSSGGIHD